MQSESTKLIALQAQIYENYASQIKFVGCQFRITWVQKTIWGSQTENLSDP